MVGLMTKKGKEKICKAHAGDAALPAIVKIAFGKGGTGEDGQPMPPTGDELAIKQPLLEKGIESHSFPSQGVCEYQCHLEKAELAGEFISELGLIDSDGDLVAYRTCLALGKDDDMEISFTMQESFEEVL